MAAPDKGLSGISIWLSLVLLAGIVVLPFLPGDGAKQPAPGGQTAPIGSVSGATKSPDATASGGDGEDTVTGERVDEAWTQAELTGALRCQPKKAQK